MRREIALLLMLAGCTPVEMRGGGGGEARVCAGEGVQDAVGAPASAGAIEGIRRRSGAKSVRVVRPGEAVTMDFRSDRVTVTVDGHRVITQVVCG